MNVTDFSSTAPNIGSVPSLQNSQGRSPSNARADKTMDIFIPSNLKDFPNASSPTRARRHTTLESPPSVKQPRSDSGSPRSSINYNHSKSSVNLIYGRNSPRSVKKFSTDSNINTNEITNFNRDLANSLDIDRLKDIYDKEELPFIDLNYLVDNDYICRINSKEKVPNRDPSENILLKHDIPQVSIDQREQMKFLVQVIYDAVTHTREMNKYYTSPIDFNEMLQDKENAEEDDYVDMSNINFPQMKCEMDIWLSTLNECVKAIGSRLKPIALIILVIQRELKKNFKQLTTAVDIQNEIITQFQRQQNNADRQYKSSSNKNSASKDTNKEKPKEQETVSAAFKNDSKSSSTTEEPPMVGVLKRDVQHLEERVTQLKCELIAAQSELKHKEKHCEKLLDVNHHLRETITTAERKVAALSVKSTEVGASGLGHVPDAAQVVWGELSSFARDMTKALKKVNMDLLLPESTAQIGQPKVSLTSAPTTGFRAKAARRKSYASTVQNNLLFDFDIYSLANSGQQPAKEGHQQAAPATPSAAPRVTMQRPAPGGGGDAFPRAGPTVSFQQPSKSGGDAFPKANAGPTVSFPPANSGGGDAFPKANAGPTDAFPKANTGGDAFPRANATIAFPPANKSGGDAFPKANTGGDAFPKANAGPTVSFPPANSGGGGGDAFPKANNGPTDAFPKANTGGDAFPRANNAIAFPSAIKSGDAFPRANTTIAFPPPPVAGGEAFPKSSTNSTAMPSFSNPSGAVGFNVVSRPSPSAMNVPPNKNASAPFQKRVRAPTRADKKLHFTNFFPVMCSFTETCSGGLFSKPPSSIYTQLESELRSFLVQIFQKYKERMGDVKSEIEKMNDKFNNQLAHMKEGSASRSLWTRVLFRNEDYISLPKDVKVTDDYQVTTFSEIARAIIGKMRPQESEAFVKMLTFGDSNNESNQEAANNAEKQPLAAPEQSHAPAKAVNNNATMNVRPTNASDALFDSFPPKMTDSLVNFIAFVNKFAKSDISIDLFRRFFTADLPFTHFIFFCKFYLYSQNLTSDDEKGQQLRINALSQIFNKYGYNTTFPQEVRTNLEGQYCSSFASFIVLAMSLYSHVITKLSKYVEVEMQPKPSSPSSKSGSVNFGAKFARGSIGKQTLLLNYLKDNVINYVEPEKPKTPSPEEEEEDDNDDYERKREERKKKEEKSRQKPIMTPEKEAENKNAVEYMRAIAGSAKDLSSIEVAVEMFNYIIPLDNCLEDFDPQNSELLTYLSTFGDKGKKGKKGKDKNKRVLEPIKPGDLLSK